MHDVTYLLRMGGPFMYLVLALGVMGVLAGTVMALVAALGKWTPSFAWLAMPAAVVMAGVVGTMLGTDMALEAISMAVASEQGPMAAHGRAIASLTDLTGLAIGAFLFAATALFGGAVTAIGAGKEAKWSLAVGLPPLALSVLVGGGLIAWALIGQMGVLALVAGGAATFGLLGCGLAGLRVAGGDDGPGKTAAARTLFALCAATGPLLAGLAGRLHGLFDAYRAIGTAAPETRQTLWAAGHEAADQALLLGLAGAAAVLVLGSIPALPLLPKLVEPRTLVSAAVSFVLLLLPVMAARLLMAGGMGELSDVAVTEQEQGGPDEARLVPTPAPEPLFAEPASEPDAHGLPLLEEELDLSGVGGGLGTRGTDGEMHAPAGGAGVSASGDPIVLGALDRSEIDRVIKRHLAQIKYCYQRVLTKEPGVEGKLIIKFVIARDGTVSSATVKPGSTLDHSEVEECVKGRFLRMQFPQPTGGGIVIVSYPFVFRAG